MCTFGLSGCRVKPRRPHQTRPPGLAHDSPRTPNVHISGPLRFKHHQNSTRRPPERHRNSETVAGKGRKSAKFWAPNPSGPHPSGPHPFGAPPFWAPPFGAPLFLGLGPPTHRGPTLRGPTLSGPHPFGAPPFRGSTLRGPTLSGQARVAVARAVVSSRLLHRAGTWHSLSVSDINAMEDTNMAPFRTIANERWRSGYVSASSQEVCRQLSILTSGMRSACRNCVWLHGW